MSSAKELKIKLPYTTLAAKEWGSTCDKTIIALHGWLDNAASFDRLAPGLVGFRVIAIDLPGHGLSGHKPVGSMYHISETVAEVILALQQLGLTEYHLLGHSLGAAVASLVAGTVPEQVASLVLLDAIGPYTQKAEEAPKCLNNYIEAAVHHERSVTKTYATKAAAVDTRQRIGNLTLDAAKILMERNLKQQDGEFVLRRDIRLTYPSPKRYTEPEVLSFLSQITARSLFIRANSGLPLGEEMLAQRIAAIKQLQCEHVDGGHHVHLEHPDRVLPILKKFYVI